MKFGICGDAAFGQLAAAAGFDYLETSVGGLLLPQQDETAFRASLKEYRSNGISCEVLNCLLPRNLKVCGTEVDFAALRRYIETVMVRMETAGLDRVVFGSGGSRRIPDGFDPQTAHGQHLEFSAMTAALAAEHGVIVALEPLNKKECNVLTTVAECATLVREVNHPNFRLLVDGFHMMTDDDSYQSIVDNGDILVHAHLATRENRLVPGMEPCDFAQFFASLIQAGYDGRVSIEAAKQPEGALRSGLALMKEALYSMKGTS
jgi:sugar phosphate isomerase/epimerase